MIAREPDINDQGTFRVSVSAVNAPTPTSAFHLCCNLPSKRSFSSFLASLLSFLNCLSISALILFCSFCSSLKQQAIFIYIVCPSLTDQLCSFFYHFVLNIMTWPWFGVKLSEKLLLCFLCLYD